VVALEQSAMPRWRNLPSSAASRRRSRAGSGLGELAKKNNTRSNCCQQVIREHGARRGASTHQRLKLRRGKLQQLAENAAYSIHGGGGSW